MTSTCLQNNTLFDAVDARHRPTLLRLHTQIIEGRLPHSLLITHTDIARLLDYRMLLKRLWLCTQPHHTSANCTCASCQALETHPDYSELGINCDDLTIDHVRHSQSAGVRKPVLANRRLLLIAHAEQLTTQAQNALLKTLEEPPTHLCFILLVSHTHGLLQTIRSRCRIVRLAPISTPSTQNTDQALNEVPKTFAAYRQASLATRFKWAEAWASTHETLEAIMPILVTQLSEAIRQSNQPSERVRLQRSFQALIRLHKDSQAHVNRRLLLEQFLLKL